MTYMSWSGCLFQGPGGCAPSKRPARSAAPNLLYLPVALAMKLGRILVMLSALSCATGCVVPLSLEEAHKVADGGTVLAVRGATPPFGVKRAIKKTDSIVYSLEIESDSATLAGRLYL